MLTGGGAVRLGGADKGSIELGGRTLLEHVLAALAEVPEVVVVGPELTTSRPVTFTLEDPPGGGPAAGLLAGLGRFARVPALVIVVAVDMPLVTPATVSRLTDAARAREGAVLLDETGRLQYLCAAYSVAALERSGARLSQDGRHGLSMRRLVEGLDLAPVPPVGPEARDVDTWEDLATLRDAFDAPGSPGASAHGSHPEG